MKLLISDLDGTIVETEDYHRLAYNALFKELGLSQNWSKQDYMDRLQTMGGNKFREVFSWLRPGIRRLFAEVQDAGVPIAIATACVGWAAEQVIEAGLGKEFLESLAVLCGGESTERKKPHPDIYLLVAEKTGIDPSDCVVLEDTRHGLLAAKSAGMNCLVTPSEFAQDHDLTEADRVSPDLETPGSVVLKDLQSLLSQGSRGQ
jgi:beta-phosphoglucomutase-like phosphatase (HAD superfamily)